MYFVCRFALVSGLIFSIGCGGGDGPELGYVSGKVTLDGQPLAGATVTIQPDKGAPAIGHVGKDGSYEMEFKVDKPGAPVGTSKILVTLPFEEPMMNENMGPEEMAKATEKAAAKTGIPRKWRDGTSTITVAPGSNTFDIEMTKGGAGG